MKPVGLNFVDQFYIALKVSKMTSKDSWGNLFSRHNENHIFKAKII